MAELIALLNAQNLELSKAELESFISEKALLKGRLAFFDASKKEINLIAKQSVLVKLISEKKFETKLDEKEITKKIQAKEFQDLFKEKIFSVQVSFIKQNIDWLNPVFVANLIEQGTVDLIKPDLRLRLIVQGKKVYFCFNETKIKANFIDEKKLKYRSSTSLKAILSRTIINLSQARKNKTFLDCFCGSGITLIDACAIGCKVTGIDSNKVFLQACKENLKKFNAKAKLICIDFLDYKGKEFGAIATDFPYNKREKSRIKYEKFVGLATKKIYELLENKKRACIILPSNKKTLIYNKFRVQGIFKLKVHGSLNRFIWILEKKQNNEFEKEMKNKKI